MIDHNPYIPFRFGIGARVLMLRVTAQSFVVGTLVDWTPAGIVFQHATPNPDGTVDIDFIPYGQIVKLRLYPEEPPA